MHVHVDIIVFGNVHLMWGADCGGSRGRNNLEDMKFRLNLHINYCMKHEIQIIDIVIIIFLFIV